MIAAAAGGPKWMTLYPLYKFIFGDWLASTQHTIDLMGASAGAWSMACAAQTNPLNAFEHYLKGYAEQRYPNAPTAAEISTKCNEIISGLLGENGVSEILNPARYNLHIVTSPSTFEYHADSLKRKLFVAAFWNALSRKNLNKYFSRNIYSAQKTYIVGTDLINTTHRQLSSSNINQVLLASGAIPTVIDPVVIDGQVHWDGGITDYHLDLNYKLEDGIVLYPHFHHKIIPGWLDKYLKIRKADPKHHDSTVLIHPSQEFINTLPNKAIPTRKDFETYFQKDDARITMWYKSIEQCEALAEDFKTLVSDPIEEKDVLNF